MKQTLFVASAIFISSLSFPCHAVDDNSDTKGSSETSRSVTDEYKSDPSYWQTVHLMAGPISPASVTVSNGTYDFSYSAKPLNSIYFEAGWNAEIFRLLGAWEIQTDLGATAFSGMAHASQGAGDQQLNLRLLAISLRLAYSADWFPWHVLVPFVEGGYQYTFYYQSGSADLDSAAGGVGNPVASAGLKIWLNHGASTSSNQVKRFSTFPFFLTAKVSRVFPASDSLNLASTFYLAGISIGI